MKEKVKIVICIIVYLLAVIGISYTILIENRYGNIITMILYALSLYTCGLSIGYIVKTKMMFWTGVIGIIIGIICLALSILLSQQDAIIFFSLPILFVSIVNLICGFILKVFCEDM